MTARVLVLDDDELMCQLLDRLLTRQGYCVATESSPAEALARLTVESFDVVLSDVNMEGLDGMAFTQRVKAAGHEVPVILITGASTMDLAMGAVLAGAWDFLLKPLDARLLAASMARAVKHRRLSLDLTSLRAQLA